MNDRVKSFAIAALIAAYLGFWSSWVIPAGVAQLAFFVFVIGAFVSAVLASGNGASSRPLPLSLGPRQMRVEGFVKGR